MVSQPDTYAVICKQLLKRKGQKQFRLIGLQGIVSQEEYFLTTDKKIK